MYLNKKFKFTIDEEKRAVIVEIPLDELITVNEDTTDELAKMISEEMSLQFEDARYDYLKKLNTSEEITEMIVDKIYKDITNNSLYKCIAKNGVDVTMINLTTDVVVVLLVEDALKLYKPVSVAIRGVNS